MLDRRSLARAPRLILALLAATPAAQAKACDLPRDFIGQYLIDFWHSHPAGTILPDAGESERVPGLRRTVARTFIPPRSGISAREADRISRQLAIAIDAVMRAPSLAQLHGVSVIPSINMERAPNGLVRAILSIDARSIDLGNPKTIQREGGYFTPGEMDHIDIRFNIPPRNVNSVPIGMCDGVPLRRDGPKVAPFVNLTGRPIFVDRMVQGFTQTDPNPALLDPHMPSTTLQFLDIGLQTGSIGERSISRHEAEPTSTLGRLYAALFMTDWVAVARRMTALERTP